jgi:hypothetical protein
LFIVAGRVEIIVGKDKRRDTIFVAEKDIKLSTVFDVPDDDEVIIARSEKIFSFGEYLVYPTFMTIVDFLVCFIMIHWIKSSNYWI